MVCTDELADFLYKQDKHKYAPLLVAFIYMKSPLGIQSTHLAPRPSQVQVRREIETTSTNPPKSFVKASVGVSWHKNTDFKKKITKNIHDHMAKEIREVMNVSVKEVKARIKDKRISTNGSNNG